MREGAGDKEAAAEERLRLKIEAYHATALVYAAVKLRLPERMGEEGWTAEQLAADLGLSAPHLLRFLRGLESIGICEERPDGSFALTGLGESLRLGSSSRLGEKVQIVVEHYWQPWANLLHTVETGEPAFDSIFGMPVAEWRREHGTQGALFNSYLARETLAQAGTIIEALDVSGVRTAAEIIGGYGGLLAAILRAHPHIEGILFEQPDTLAGAAQFLESAGVVARVTLVGGDISRKIPVQADLYLLHGVLQRHADTEALAILRASRKAMPDGARLVIIEPVLPETASEAPATVMLDLHLMTIYGGRLRRLAEVQHLLSQAQLALSNATPTRSGLTIIEASSA